MAAPGVQLSVAAESYFRRSRRAFEVAFRCHGDSKTEAGALADRAASFAVCCHAATFSATMRRYSAGEQVPRAIIMLRRAIVSQDAAANSIIMMGSGGGCLCLRRFMRRHTYGCFANDSEST